MRTAAKTATYRRLLRRRCAIERRLAMLGARERRRRDRAARRLALLAAAVAGARLDASALEGTLDALRARLVDVPPDDVAALRAAGARYLAALAPSARGAPTAVASPHDEPPAPARAPPIPRWLAQDGASLLDERSDADAALVTGALLALRGAPPEP